MIDIQNVPPVTAPELLARYVLQSNYIRQSNRTVKADAFIPHPYPDLSVTRHLVATESEMWAADELVACQTGKTLYGRADVRAADFMVRGLAVLAQPLPENPNHADVSNWPPDKPAQKIIALEVATLASFVEKPG